MSSVTHRIKEIKQPRGGYIKPSALTATALPCSDFLYSHENIPASNIGLAVDYLTRFIMSSENCSSPDMRRKLCQDAFHISLIGIYNAQMTLNTDIKYPEIWIAAIAENPLSDIAICAACNFAVFDVWYRFPEYALTHKDRYRYARTSLLTEPAIICCNYAEPDADTIHNIRVMVQRSITFWHTYGPIVKSEFTFEGGYTQTIDTGDGDYLTADTLWDFKVSVQKPTNKHTLQILVYWLMGLHSGKPEFKSVRKLGLYNPRLNTVYTIDTNLIQPNIIKTVETAVIGY